jgi:hypothetical protein
MNRTKKLAPKLLLVAVLCLLALTQLPLPATGNQIALCRQICTPDAPCLLECVDDSGLRTNCATYTDGNCVW